MKATAAVQVAAKGHVVRDKAFLWIQIGMVVCIMVAVIASALIARSNKRLSDVTKRRREQRRSEAHAAEANIDALSGRPQLPQSGTPPLSNSQETSVGAAAADCLRKPNSK